MLRSMILHHGGFPIRKSADIMLICSSPQLIAAYHVLHRLLMPRHSPYALVRLNFLYNVSHYTMVLFELSEFLWTLRSGLLTLFRMKRLLFAFCTCFEFVISTFRWNCIPFSFGKTNYLFKIICPLLFVSTQIFLLFDCQRSLDAFASWSVWMDSNHRPRAYQARALATWATNRN